MYSAGFIGRICEDSVLRQVLTTQISQIIHHGAFGGLLLIAARATALPAIAVVGAGLLSPVLGFIVLFKSSALQGAEAGQPAGA
jgi:uncharacterized sodium:solute symporter family permease YidK